MNIPIVLFVYNRPQHTQKTIDILLKNIGVREYPLYVYSDGHKGHKGHKDYKLVCQVRSLIKSTAGFKSVTLIESEANKGLAESIINGVTEVVNRYGKVIVLEDDMLTSKYFLKYMSDALRLYESNAEVYSVHGYSFNADFSAVSGDTFFIKGADCWGWATWRRAWAGMELDGKLLYDKLRQQGLSREFDYNGAYPYMRMLYRQSRGDIDSWAIRWRASVYLRGGISLWPKNSLIQNIGLDGSGANCRAINNFDVDMYDKPVNIGCITLAADPVASSAVGLFLARQKVSFFRQVVGFIRRKLNWLS